MPEKANIWNCAWLHHSHIYLTGTFSGYNKRFTTLRQVKFLNLVSILIWSNPFIFCLPPHLIFIIFKPTYLQIDPIPRFTPYLTILLFSLFRWFPLIKIHGGRWKFISRFCLPKYAFICCLHLPPWKREK